MRFDGYDNEAELRTEDDVVEEVLGENARARDLRLMRAALEQRQHGLRRDQQRAAAANDVREQTRLQTQLNELEKQIEALKREEAISAFVEDSVRVTLQKSGAEGGGEWD